MTDLTVSVVIVTYHTGPCLYDAIQSVLIQAEVDQLILVDNGNPDEVVERLTALAESDRRVDYLRGHGNIGFAAGCNLGARSVSGDLLLLLNPDCILPANAFVNLLGEIDQSRPLWMAGGRLVSPNGDEQSGDRRQILTPWRAFVEVFRLNRLLSNHPYFDQFNSHCQPLPSQTCEVPVISGACLLISLQAYWAMGGMDEGYFLHVEDIDFCLRFLKVGGKIYFVPNAVIVHRKGSSEANSVVIEWHKARGFQRYFRKNFTGKYPPGFLGLVAMGIWGRFLLKAPKGIFIEVTRKICRWPKKDGTASRGEESEIC